MTRHRTTLAAAASDAEWLAAARASGQPPTPLRHPRFLRAAARVTARRLTLLVVRRDDEPVGVLPWLEHRRGPVATLNRVPFPYAAPAVPADLLEETLAAAWRRGRARGVVVQAHRFPPGTDVDLVGARRAGFAAATSDTFVVPTTGTREEIERAVARRHRRQVAKAERLGVVVLDETRPERATAALDAALSSIFAGVEEPSGYADPLGLTRAELEGEGLQVRWAVAELDGEAVGCIVSLAHEGAALAWLGGVRREHRGTAANTLLYWDALHWAHDIGAGSLDLSGTPTAAIADFKAKFGGARESYSRLERDLAARRWVAAARARVR